MNVLFIVNVKIARDINISYMFTKPPPPNPPENHVDYWAYNN